MQYDRNRVFAGACLGMLTYGIVMTVLGAVLPSLIARFGVDMAVAGSLCRWLNAGVFCGNVLFGPVVDRYGYRGFLMLSAVLVLVALEGIAFAPTFAMLQACVFVVGLGGSGLNGGTNALVAETSGPDRNARLSLLGMFFGIGACGIPFAIGFLLDAFSYGPLIAVMGGLVLVPLAFFAANRFPPAKHAGGFPLAQSARLARDPALLLLGLVLFLEGGIEMTAGGWTATYFVEVLALAPDRAAFVLAVFWGGLVAGRLLLAVLLRTRSALSVLWVHVGIALAGSVLLLASSSLVPAVAGVVLMGFGFSPCFPVVYALAGERYAHLTGTAFGMLLVMSVVGASLFPYVAGHLGESGGLRLAFVLIPASLLLMLPLLWAVVRALGIPMRE